VVLKSGKRVGYEQLVVCPGLQLDWHKVQGLQETLGRPFWDGRVSLGLLQCSPRARG